MKSILIYVMGNFGKSFMARALQEYFGAMVHTVVLEGPSVSNVKRWINDKEVGVVIAVWPLYTPEQVESLVPDMVVSSLDLTRDDKDKIKGSKEQLKVLVSQEDCCQCVAKALTYFYKYSTFCDHFFPRAPKSVLLNSYNVMKKMSKKDLADAGHVVVIAQGQDIPPRTEFDMIYTATSYGGEDIERFESFCKETQVEWMKILTNK